MRPLSRLLPFLLLGLSACPGIQYTDKVTAVPMATDKPKADTRVLAKAEEWRNSGVIVEKGKKYSIKAKGRWRHGPSCAWTGPDGIGAYTALCWDLGGQIVTGWSHAALTAKIGEGGSPFGVGNEMELSPEETGTLYFRINEGLGFNGDTDVAQIASTAFPMWDLETAIQRQIKAQEVVTISDTCHAGGVGGGIGTKAWILRRT